VLADDPYIDHAQYRADEIHFVDLEEIIRRSDILTLHVPLTTETTDLICASNIGTFRPGSVLINTARGKVISDLDLLSGALEDGILAGVGLDVFPDEPPDTRHPLFHHPAAVLTCHVAARSVIAQRRILNTMVEEVAAILEGRQPNLNNVVNPEVFSRGL
jgi:phosphoglycerate dehydrogenase-like enzyme